MSVENPSTNDYPKSKRLILLEKTENLIVSILLFLIVSLVLAQVYSRFIAESSITWTGELSRFLAIWLIFLGSAIALRRSMHIQVDNLYEIVSNRLGIILYIIRNIIILGFFIVIFIGSISMLEIVTLQKSPSLGIQMDLVYIIMPISLCLMAVILIIQTCLRFRRKRG